MKRSLAERQTISGVVTDGAERALIGREGLQVVIGEGWSCASAHHVRQWGSSEVAS